MKPLAPLPTSLSLSKPANSSADLTPLFAPPLPYAVAGLPKRADENSL